MASTHGEHNHLPPLIAVKSALFSESKSLSTEKEFLDKFQACPCILRCFGDDVTIEENNVKSYNLLLEYAAGGCLADRKGLSESIVSRHTKSVLTALIHMHKLGYVHCDVKPHNVLLVGPQDEEEAKLADYGSCQSCNQIRDSCDVDDFKGTVLYAAPESIARQEYLPESDVWSLGCTVLHMLTGKSPWVIDKNKMDVKDVFLMIGYGSQIPHIPKNIFKEAKKDFLSKCLVKDPASRWKADRLIHHPFLNRHRTRHLHLPSRLVPRCFHLPKVHAC